MTCGKKPGMLFGRAPALYDILFLYSLPPLPELFLCMKEAGISPPTPPQKKSQPPK
jgi:hypothetical protein